MSDMVDSRASRVRIGCAGWALPSAVKPRFGRGDSVLAVYATRFDAVEINSSFYRPHRRSTYQRWGETVPDGFRFSAKLPRNITHDAGLHGVAEPLSAFIDEVSGLRDKLGALLVQLPPRLAFDAAVAARFFAMLERRTPAAVVCEPRHRTWFEPAATELLQRHRVARAGVDPPQPRAEAARPTEVGDVRYWRWHGSPRIYYSGYGEQRLRGMAEAACRDRHAKAETWCIFDNTAAGHAVDDALSFQALCRSTADA
ncbi:DUF72 domain-containing protein [Lysobacter sp. CA196]|uniref:DUF72 domain-containing protein n=1 Tax=Lysobacter sp. CA196 TaxID=3455606 RepID=UPI003F8D3BE5